jgi:heme-degrading monooxygenase HmoA
LLLFLKQGVGLDDKTFGTHENVLYKLVVERKFWLRRRRTMRVLSYLRMGIDPDQMASYQRDLEEMLRLARQMPGFLEAEVLQVRREPNTYLVLSEWESHEAMHAFLMQKRHIEIIRGYKRGYGKGFERRRYTRFHGVRKELIE